MIFDPLSTYTGTPVPVKYIVKDVTGQVDDSTYTPTVIPAPVAVADTSKNGQDINQTINILGNDTIPTNGNSLDPTSVKLCALADATANPPVTAEVSPNCSLTELVIPGVGTYTVNTNGTVTFDPEPGFTGPATQVKYQVSDTGTGVVKQTTSSTISPTVVPAPTARPDTTSGGQGQPQVTNLLTNTAGSDSASTVNGATLVASSVKLCAVANPSATPPVTAEVAPDCTKTSVVVPGVGTFSVNNLGVMTFTPEAGFIGIPEELSYTVADNYGVKATSTYTPEVIPGPDANPDTTTGGQDVNQSINLLTNTDGKDLAADGATLNAASVKLCAVANPSATPPVTAEVAPNCTKTSVVVPGVGTYTVNNIGVMTFDPLPAFTGTPTALAYTVLDSNGVKADSTYTPTVIAKPIAKPDVTTANKDVNQSVNLVTNPAASGTDAAGVAGVDLDPTTVRLCKISPAETPPNCTATTLTVAGVGTYTVDATGQMTFDPLPTYTGTPAPVKYIVKDEIGQVANSTYTPTVLTPPTVKPDTSVGPQNTSQTRNVITNSVNTGDTANSGATLVLASLAISCPIVPVTPSAIAPVLPLTAANSVALATAAAVTCTVGANGEIIMAGQGTYTIDPVNPGSLIFTPEPGFTGAAVGVNYSITDSNGQTSLTTYTPTVLPAPTARDDNSVAEKGATQWISPLGNDTGSGGAKLLPGTIFLCRTGEPPPDCEATEVVIPGQGTFTVSSYGVVKFVPEPGFTGTVIPLDYQVTDELGQKTNATIFVEVLPPPAPSATMDTGSADFNKPVTLSPWLNDFAGEKPSGSNLAAPELVPSSIRLCTTVQVPPNCDATRVTTVDGTYVVNTKTGEVVFTPVNGFIGTVTSPVTYQISNNWSGAAGPGVATSILVPTINPPGSPAATVDATTTKPGVSVVIIPVNNDKPGSSPLKPNTIRLCGTNEISPTCSQTEVTNLDGTYVVNLRTGNVTFTPRFGFTGQATIPYVITDTLGKKANANIIITVEDKPELPKTGGHRPDLLLILGILAMLGAGGLRFASRKG
jgi:LPXTG-motif cell wall-anchored protein